MPSSFFKIVISVALVSVLFDSSYADEEEFNLTKSIQESLVLLGYEPGNVDGEVTLQTAVAISQFQAHNNLEVTGEVSPQLAGILAAKVSGPPQPISQSEPEHDAAAQTESVPQSEPAEPAEPIEPAEPTGQVVASPPEDPEVVATVAEPAEEQVAVDPEVLEAARQKCIRKKIEKAQEAEKKRRGYSSLASALGRTASQLGNDDVAQATGDIYAASATASDLKQAAKDLGLSEDDLEECNNPL